MKKSKNTLSSLIKIGLLGGVLLLPALLSLSARADQQNLLPALTDDTGWALKKAGSADAKLSYNNEGMVVQIAAVDGQAAHIEVDHPGVSLAEGKIYLLSFEGRSDAAFALIVHAVDDTPTLHSAGLNQTVYLTPHWTPFRMTFTAQQVSSKHVIVPQFLFGRQIGNVSLRNASLVQLAAPPPPDAGLPKFVSPHTGETALGGSVRSLLPSGKGFVMWVTSKTIPDGSIHPQEPPQVQTVLWAGAQILSAGKPLTTRDVLVGNLISVAGTAHGVQTALKARQVQTSHGLEPVPTPQ